MLLLGCRQIRKQRLKDKWESDNVTLYLGDNMEILPTLEARSVDVVITDPPYGAKRPSARRSAHERFAEIQNNDVVHSAWLIETSRICKEAVYCFCTWQTMEEWRRAMTDSGLAVRSCIVWDKQIHGLADIKTCWAPQHEFILFGSKNNHKLQGKRPKDVCSIARLAPNELMNPYQKPVPLIEAMLRPSTKPGAVVGDWFMGSGTTGVACVKMGRKFIGIEIDENYFEIAKKRIQEAQLQPRLI